MKIEGGLVVADGIVVHVVTKEWLEKVREVLRDASADMDAEYNHPNYDCEDMIDKIDEMIGKPDDNG